MLKELFSKLDARIVAQNQTRKDSGSPLVPRAEIRVVGQLALAEANLGIELAQTKDFDGLGELPNFTREQLKELLQTEGWHLESDWHLIKMPAETEYVLVHEGAYIVGYRARPEYILISKAQHAPEKNRSLLIEYLANEPSELFFRLAKIYNIDLERFV